MDVTLFIEMPMLFGEIMKEARIDQGLSQSDIGQKGHISKYEKGIRPMSFQKAIEFIEILNLDEEKAILAYFNTLLHTHGYPYQVHKLKK